MDDKAFLNETRDGKRKDFEALKEKVTELQRTARRKVVLMEEIRVRPYSLGCGGDVLEFGDTWIGVRRVHFGGYGCVCRHIHSIFLVCLQTYPFFWCGHIHFCRHIHFFGVSADISIFLVWTCLWVCPFQVCGVGMSISSVWGGVVTRENEIAYTVIRLFQISFTSTPQHSYLPRMIRAVIKQNGHQPI